MNIVCRTALVLGLISGSQGAYAEVDSTPRAIIKKMAGCFKVTFQYIEDGEHDHFYEPVYESAALSEKDGELSLQRQMVINGTTIKHWSETWQDLGDNVWSQEVRGPYGNFRYKCEGTWVKNLWRCDADQSPKPRRDTDRGYAFIDRENTLVINDQRWVHSQKNLKKTAEDELFAAEVGFNIYEKVEDSLCSTGS